MLLPFSRSHMNANFYKLFAINSFFWMCILCLGTNHGLAQKNQQSNKEKREFSPLNIQQGKQAPDLTANFAFPNLNKDRYYYDKKLMTQIRLYNKAKEWEKLYPILKNYINNFGIENFYKDTYWLWRYAKITELLGSLEESKAFYRLVLKHHNENMNIRTIELHYDSLTANEVERYVPLEYYYELVEYRKAVDTLYPPRGVNLNIGDAINSYSEDYAPTLSVNDHLLIFTSSRNTKKKNLEQVTNEDIFYSHNKHGFWTEAKEFYEINTLYHEGSGCLSKDGKTLYFTRCSSPESFGSCDLFVTKKQENGKWSSPYNLGANINSVAWDSHPSLSHNDDTLFFTSDRIGGFGLHDIYYTYRDKSGDWVKAKNAGPIINTRKSEISPFYHPEFEILYFSSNGHLLNFGEYDIYKSRKKKDKWEEPKNIGPLVNYKGSEIYFTIDSKSENLFYSKSKQENMKNMDIFTFPLPMGAHPDANTIFKGRLVDANTNKPLGGIVSIIDLDNGIEVAPRFIAPDGTFQFNLINNNNYLLIIQGDEYFRIEDIFKLEGDTYFEGTTEPITSRIKFNSIEFDEGKYDLKSGMYGDLNKVSNFLLDNPTFNLKIAGHTDAKGGSDANMMLSLKRSQSIQDYIIFFGDVDASRLEAFGYGSSQPIRDVEETDEDKALNRRVEFILYRVSKEELEKMRINKQKKDAEKNEEWGDN